MLAKALTCAMVGLEGCVVEAEVDISPGLPAFKMAGLPDAAVQEFERLHFDEMVGKILFGWRMAFPATTKAVKGYHTFNFNVYSGIPLYERLWLAK